MWEGVCVCVCVGRQVTLKVFWNLLLNLKPNLLFLLQTFESVEFTHLFFQLMVNVHLFWTWMLEGQWEHEKQGRPDLKEHSDL